MKVMLFAARDAQMGGYLEPICALTEGMAMRSFRMAVETPEHQFAVNPQDYALFYLGEFDQDTGVLIPAEQVRQICTGLQMKQMAQGGEMAPNGRGRPKAGARR